MVPKVLSVIGCGVSAADGGDHFAAGGSECDFGGGEGDGEGGGYDGGCGERDGDKTKLALRAVAMKASAISY